MLKPDGDPLPAMRAHTTTLVGTRLYIFGGGDGIVFYNEVWALDLGEILFAPPSLGLWLIDVMRRSQSRLNGTSLTYAHPGRNGLPPVVRTPPSFTKPT